MTRETHTNANKPSTPLWTPTPEQIERSPVTTLMREVGAADYDALWEWSVADVGRFWQTLWQKFDVQADGDPTIALADGRMPGARWFPDVALSLPEHVWRGKDDDALAIQFAGEGTTTERAWTWGRLREETARVRTGLQALGVERGDRVVGYLPNVPETIAAFFAVSSLGAIWSCCSPDFGTRTVIDRFAQIEPKVLLACDGYRYNGKTFDRTPVAAEIAAALPTLAATIQLSYLGGDDGWAPAFPAPPEPLEFARVPFDHPLWILYSSGTTGLPKPIVHGHGGILLENLKLWRLTQAVNPEDRLLWTTTTGWVMWNLLVGALLSDASIVLYEGSFAHPDLNALWDVIERTGVTVFGTGGPSKLLHGGAFLIRSDGGSGNSPEPNVRTRGSRCGARRGTCGTPPRGEGSGSAPYLSFNGYRFCPADGRRHRPPVAMFLPRQGRCGRAGATPQGY